jgi:hypothetical protein
MPKIKMVCPYCGGDDVGRDATVRWNIEKQDWELSGIFDDGFCDDCSTDVKSFNEVEVPDA